MSDADGLALALTPEQLDRLWQMVISPENDEERPAPPEGETGRRRRARATGDAPS